MVYANFSSNLPTELQNFEIVDLTNTGQADLHTLGIGQAFLHTLDIGQADLLHTPDIWQGIRQTIKKTVKTEFFNFAMPRSEIKLNIGPRKPNVVMANLSSRVALDVFITTTETCLTTLWSPKRVFMT